MVISQKLTKIDHEMARLILLPHSDPSPDMAMLGDILVSDVEKNIYIQILIWILFDFDVRLTGAVNRVRPSELVVNTDCPVC